MKRVYEGIARLLTQNPLARRALIDSVTAPQRTNEFDAIESDAAPVDRAQFALRLVGGADDRLHHVIAALKKDGEAAKLLAGYSLRCIHEDIQMARKELALCCAEAEARSRVGRNDRN